MHKRAVLIGMITIASSLMFSPVAHARRFRLPKGLGLRGGSKNYTPDTLTQPQLEACLVEGRDLDDAEATIAQSEAELSRLEEELAELANRIDQEGRLLDRYSQSAVDNYNALVETYESMRTKFNERVEQHNAGLEEIGSTVNEYNARCANRPYFEDDMVAARLAAGITE